MAARRKASKRAKAAKPLTASQATRLLREYGGSPDLNFLWTEHAKEQMALRDLIVGDVLYILKMGFVYDVGVSTSRPGFFKYQMECSTPNSNNRSVRIVVILSKSRAVKVVTVMWADEPAQGAQ